MSDPRVQGPISVVAVPLADALAKHAALPPFQKNMARAAFGAGLLTLCAYTAVTLGKYAQTCPPLYLLIWTAAAGLGVLLLIVGVRGAQGQRDVMAAFWPVVVLAGCGWALWHFGGPAIFRDFYVRGFGLALLASTAVRAWLAMRGVSGNAEQMVRQQVEQNEVPWHGARRR